MKWGCTAGGWLWKYEALLGSLWGLGRIFWTTVTFSDKIMNCWLTVTKRGPWSTAPSHIRYKIRYPICRLSLAGIITKKIKPTSRYISKRNTQRSFSFHAHKKKNTEKCCRHSRCCRHIIILSSLTLSRYASFRAMVPKLGIVDLWRGLHSKWKEF